MQAAQISCVCKTASSSTGQRPDSYQPRATPWVHAGSFVSQAECLPHRSRDVTHPRQKCLFLLCTTNVIQTFILSAGSDEKFRLFSALFAPLRLTSRFNILTPFHGFNASVAVLRYGLLW